MGLDEEELVNMEEDFDKEENVRVNLKNVLEASYVTGVRVSKLVLIDGNVVGLGPHGLLNS